MINENSDLQASVDGYEANHQEKFLLQGPKHSGLNFNTNSKKSFLF